MKYNILKHNSRHSTTYHLTYSLIASCISSWHRNGHISPAFVIYHIHALHLHKSLHYHTFAFSMLFCSDNCYHNLPFNGGAKWPLGWAKWVHLPLKENVWSRHQCLFKENVRKTKMEKVEGLCILKMRV